MVDHYCKVKQAADDRENDKVDADIFQDFSSTFGFHQGLDEGFDPDSDKGQDYADHGEGYDDIPGDEQAGFFQRFVYGFQSRQNGNIKIIKSNIGDGEWSNFGSVNQREAGNCEARTFAEGELAFHRFSPKQGTIDHVGAFEFVFECLSDDQSNQDARQDDQNDGQDHEDFIGMALDEIQEPVRCFGH
jgi:hypothetical protein